MVLTLPKGKCDEKNLNLLPTGKFFKICSFSSVSALLQYYSDVWKTMQLCDVADGYQRILLHIFCRVSLFHSPVYNDTLHIQLSEWKMFCIFKPPVSKRIHLIFHLIIIQWWPHTPQWQVISGVPNINVNVAHQLQTHHSDSWALIYYLVSCQVQGL